MSKHTFINENFKFGKMSLQCVRSFNYLGFQINSNGKFRNLVQDRILKATNMSNMVLRAIGHNKNILLYGAAIWSLPDTLKLLYLLEQPEDTRYNTRQLSRLPSQTRWAEICRMNMQGAWGRDPMPVIEKSSFVSIASRTKMKFCVVVKIQRMSLWILILSPIIPWKTA